MYGVRQHHTTHRRVNGVVNHSRCDVLSMGCANCLTRAGPVQYSLKTEDGHSGAFLEKGRAEVAEFPQI